MEGQSSHTGALPNGKLYIQVHVAIKGNPVEACRHSALDFFFCMIKVGEE